MEETLITFDALKMTTPQDNDYVVIWEDEKFFRFIKLSDIHPCFERIHREETFLYEGKTYIFSPANFHLKRFSEGDYSIYSFGPELSKYLFKDMKVYFEDCDLRKCKIVEHFNEQTIPKCVERFVAFLSSGNTGKWIGV